LFTTGRGTPFGTFIPTMKISTNTQLSKFKSKWIDFNAGALIEDGCVPSDLLASLIDKIIATVNGENKLHHEQIGAKEIAIFKSGVTL
jgi:altronate hydrolase